MYDLLIFISDIILLEYIKDKNRIKGVETYMNFRNKVHVNRMRRYWINLFVRFLDKKDLKKYSNIMIKISLGRFFDYMVKIKIYNNTNSISGAIDIDTGDILVENLTLLFHRIMLHFLY